MTLALSCPGLGPFWDERHEQLAAELGKADLRALATLHDPVFVSRTMGGLGLYRRLVPPAYGGGPASRADDLDVRSLVLVREALGQVSPLADAIFAVQGLGTWPIARFGDDEQRARFLPAAMRGDALHAFALTEPEAGSDVASLQTLAVDDGDAWVLSGEKCFISNVPLADRAVVFATVDPALGRKGITAFVVELGGSDRPPRGVTVEPMPMSIPHPIGRIRFDGARIPKSTLLGERGQGFKIAMATLDAFRITVGAAANGMASRALASALAHVTTRRQFGAPLAEQALVKGMLADLATELDAARLLVARAAWLRDTGDGTRISKEAAMAKMYATEAAQRIVDGAVQLHGGKGVLAGSDVEALYREIRPLRIYEGATEVQKLVIAKALLDELVRAPRS